MLHPAEAKLHRLEPTFAIRVAFALIQERIALGFGEQVVGLVVFRRAGPVYLLQLCPQLGEPGVALGFGFGEPLLAFGVVGAVEEVGFVVAALALVAEIAPAPFLEPLKIGRWWEVGPPAALVVLPAFAGRVVGLRCRIDREGKLTKLTMPRGR
jgi:hypothetical protein